MNWENVLSAVLTGVIASAITGYFGVLFAFKQFRAQRAFERQLDWYEKATGAVLEFLRFNETIIFAVKTDRLDLVTELVENKMPPVTEFQKTLNNSLLYSDRDLYLRLKEVGKKLAELAKKVPGEISGEKATTEAYEGYVKLVEESLFELSKPIRKMLDLDTLSLADFEK